MLKQVAAVVMLAAFAVKGGEWKDVAYYEKDFPVQGDKKYLAERCKLDLRTPEKLVKFPTLVWFHGGGLSAGNKYIPGIINTEKIAVAAVNYRLSGKGGNCPDYIYDAAAAVAWVIRNIEKFGGDPKHVYVGGMSAGGYLTAMLMLDKRYLETFGVSPLQLAGAFPVSGQMSTHFQILTERRRKDPAVRDFLIDEYAPIYHAASKTPPMTFFTGDSNLEWPARVEENQLIVMRMRRVYKNDKVILYSIPGNTHGSCQAPSVAMINNILLKVSKKNAEMKK